MVEVGISFEGLSDSERSAELLKRRESLANFLWQKPELGVSKVDFRAWQTIPDKLVLVAQVHTEKSRQWIQENVPIWDGMQVVAYTPDDLLELTMVGYKARHIVDLLQSTDPVSRLKAIDLLQKWIGK